MLFHMLSVNVRPKEKTFKSDWKIEKIAKNWYKKAKNRKNEEKMTIFEKIQKFQKSFNEQKSIL